MSFLTPFFLILGLAAIPIVALYLLRLRRKDVFVSSTMLWQKLVTDREANMPWQRLRPNLLLFLQLLILAFLVLAMARPYLPSSSLAQGNVVVLLDGSASMLAFDIEPTRFSAAKDEVSELINDLSGDDQMTLIQVGNTPTVLLPASKDKAALKEALNASEAEPVEADWSSALTLAAGTAQGLPEPKIIILSDGGMTGDLPPLPAEVVYLLVGRGTENLAISALGTSESENGAQLFASVTNHGKIEQEATINIDVDGILIESRHINVAAGDVASMIWELPESANIIAARLSDNADDRLAIDDTAWSIHDSGKQNKALLVTDGNIFLETILSVLPGLDAFQVSPDLFNATDLTDEYDLVILDGVAMPDPLPNANFLVVDPRPELSNQDDIESRLFSTGDTFLNTKITEVTDNSILQFVDWDGVNIRQATRIDAPWADSLVTSEGGPVILVGETKGRRVALLSFRLQDSDLPLQIAFPVLMANIVNWLTPGRVIESSGDSLRHVRPGDTVTLMPVSDAVNVTIRKPNDTRWSSDIGEDSLIFDETGELGLYEVKFINVDGEELDGHFAVSLLATNESNIAPVKTLNIGSATYATSEENLDGQQELWPWLAGIAISILLMEWWIYHRGLNLLRLREWRARFERH